jgi:hypothetical protein
LRLVVASAAVDDRGEVTDLSSPDRAARLFQVLLDQGIIRQVYCDVR